MKESKMDRDKVSKDLPQLMTELTLQPNPEDKSLLDKCLNLAELIDAQELNTQGNKYVGVGVNYGNIYSTNVFNCQTSSNSSADIISSLPAYICRNRYNLIVVSQESYDNPGKRDNCDIFEMSYDTILGDKMTVEAIASELRSLKDDAKEKLLSYPTIVTAECKYKGYMAAPGQYARFGYLTDIIRKDHTAELSFASLNDRIPLSLLEQNMPSLGISSRTRCSELTDSRWEVKQINLIDTLRKMGMQINYPPD